MLAVRPSGEAPMTGQKTLWNSLKFRAWFGEFKVGRRPQLAPASKRRRGETDEALARFHRAIAQSERLRYLGGQLDPAPVCRAPTRPFRGSGGRRGSIRFILTGTIVIWAARSGSITAAERFWRCSAWQGHALSRTSRVENQVAIRRKTYDGFGSRPAGGPLASSGVTSVIHSWPGERAGCATSGHWRGAVRLRIESASHWCWDWISVGRFPELASARPLKLLYLLPELS
jgi:hypothetical protein